ncbi:protein translocase subunit SecF [Thiotrichales bacterium 19S9-12]|nr:protein translocase subunit SecF [Thiotrichales bacterium 19S9-11]MCF6811381.1 protein translocase subunit SecF [Thiotrichales bacterium 19S9-12]
MEFFKRKTNIDFLGIRKITAIISIVLIVSSFGFIFVKGLNWGLDFTGGYQIQVAYPHEASLKAIKKELIASGFSKAEVITFGSAKEVMIRLLPDETMNQKDNHFVSAEGQSYQEELKQNIQKALGSKAQITSVTYIGPEVGQELATNGLLAIVIAMICITAYIAFRFEFRFAVSAGIALLHDPIIILGVFALFQFEFDLTSLAAILAVIGFSLNDTVVIYDRVRENFRKMRKASVVEVVNRSVNDTMSRTIITSGLTFMVVLVLYLFGGPSIHYFSLALMLGIVVGTYSSIYVAGVLAVLFGLKREHLLAAPKVEDGLP